MCWRRSGTRSFGALDEAQHELERSRAEPGPELDERQRKRILALASDFPRLWNDPATPHRERKRMARLLIEDVTLTKDTRSLGGASARWRDPSGSRGHRIHIVPKLYRTDDEVVAEIDRLLDDHSDGEVARILNGRGYRTGYGLAFTSKLVRSTRWNRGLKSRYQRLRDRGLLRCQEMADRFAVSRGTVNRWHKCGLLRGHVYSEQAHCLFEIPEHPPTKQRGRKQRQRTPEYAPDRTREVQYEA